MENNLYKVQLIDGKIILILYLYTNKLDILESKLGMIEGCQMKSNFMGF